MKYILAFLMMCCLIFGVAHAAPSVADVRSELITNLEQDGTISSKAANEARARYLKPATASATQSTAEQPAPVAKQAEESWTRYLSWINMIKVVAVILLLVAFHGLIINIIKGLWHLIAAVPVEVYQLGFLAVTVTATIAPHLLWVSPHAFYVALFGAFANIMLFGWIAVTHDKLMAALEKLFNLGIPFGCVISFWGMLYFGGLAFFYQSQIFGFFAVVAFSGMLSFGMTYRPGVLELGFNSGMMSAVVLGHLAVLSLYVGATLTGNLPVWFSLFKAGVEFYATIALGVALLCGASPFWRDNKPLYSLLMLVLFALATAGFTMFNFTVVSSIVMVFFALWVLEWLMYVTFTTNWILGCAVTGGVLYYAGTLLQTYGHYLVFVR